MCVRGPPGRRLITFGTAAPGAGDAQGLVVTSAAAYVPRRVRHRCGTRRRAGLRSRSRLARGSGSVHRQVAHHYASSTPPTPPCSAPLRAVLLFADVSGYSALTRWMSAAFEQV
jgi:hypothetical protein